MHRRSRWEPAEKMNGACFTMIELLVNTSQHNCFSLLLKSPQLP